MPARWESLGCARCGHAVGDGRCASCRALRQDLRRRRPVDGRLIAAATTAVAVLVTLARWRG